MSHSSMLKARRQHQKTKKRLEVEAKREKRLAKQALAGPVVFHILQRPLIERLAGVELDLDPEVAVTEIAHHWLRAMRTEAP